MDETHIGHALSPRVHAMKQSEMTARRALKIIQVFEKWEARFQSNGVQGVQDWRDIDPKEFRKIYDDDRYGVQPQMELDELWRRYKNGRLYDEVLELAENLVIEKLPDNKHTKEMKDALNRISQRRPS